MFATVHDAILLVFAGLYVLVALVRAIQGGHPARASQGVWLTVPMLIAAALVLLAVVW